MNYWKIACFILAISMVTICLYLLNEITEIEQHNLILSENSADLSLKTAFYKANFTYDAQMNGVTAPDVLCEESRTTSIALSELVKDNPRLIYRHTEQQCNLCYEEELIVLDSLLADSFKLPVAVFCSYKSKPVFLAFKKNSSSKLSLLQLYNIPSGVFDWAAESCESPYYFLLHPDMKISHVYVPDKQYPELNMLYLKKIKRILFD